MALILGLPALAHAGRVAVKQVPYATPDGKALGATLFQPTGDGASPRPAVVLIHGGAWLTGSRIQMRWYGKAFAEHGYVALAISYRTMPKYTFPAPLEDAKAAVRWLRLNADAYQVDTTKIAAMGTSAGGHLALMLAMTHPSDGLEGDQNPGPSSSVAAAVSLYGPSDLRGFESTSTQAPLGAGALWRPYLRSFLGTAPVGKKKPEDAASPITYVGTDTPPLLLIHGSKDVLVPIDETERLFKRLDEVGARATMMKVDGYGHAFDHIHPRMRDVVFEKILAFLNDCMEVP